MNVFPFSIFNFISSVSTKDFPFLFLFFSFFFSLFLFSFSLHLLILPCMFILAPSLLFALEPVPLYFLEVLLFFPRCTLSKPQLLPPLHYPRGHGFCCSFLRPLSLSILTPRDILSESSFGVLFVFLMGK